MNTVNPSLPLGYVAPVPISRGRVGMACLIVAEIAIFTIFVVAYIFYAGKSLSGPTPRQVLELPVINTICLLSSSATISLAIRALRLDRRGSFGFWWLVTIVLGSYFLYGTAREWLQLIREHHLTISTNLFGTTFYALVGLHASHVIAGLLALTVVQVLTWRGAVTVNHAERAEVLALYWHFVDVVWIVVFTLVYVVER